MSAILAGARISGIAGDEATVAAGAIEETLGRRDDLEAAAAKLHRSGRVVTAGLGIDQVSAGELALKIAEGLASPPPPTTSRPCCTATSPGVTPPPRASSCSPSTRAPALAVTAVLRSWLGRHAPSASRA